MVSSLLTIRLRWTGNGVCGPGGGPTRTPRTTRRRWRTTCSNGTSPSSGPRQGLTHVPIFAQNELASPISAQLKRTSALSPLQPKLIRGCVPKVLKLISNGGDVFPKVLKLSFEVSEWKPLARGQRVRGRHLPRQGLTLVPFSAEPEPFLTLKTPLERLIPPSTHSMYAPQTPLVPQKALTLS